MSFDILLEDRKYSCKHCGEKFVSFEKWKHHSCRE